MSSTSCAPKVVTPGDGKPLHVVGDVLRIKMTGGDTGRVFSVVEEETPPNGGPPLHRHSREDEVFHLLEGDFEFRIGKSTVKAKPGSYIFAPRGIAHTLKNIGTTTGRVMVTISPPGFEEFFVEVDALGENPAAGRLMGVAEKYGLAILAP